MILAGSHGFNAIELIPDYDDYLNKYDYKNI